MPGFNFADRKDIERVLDMVHAPPHRNLLPDQTTFPQEYVTEGFLLRTPSGGIPARSGTTAGKANCTPYYINASTDTITELTDNSDAAQTFEVYNVFGTAVAGNVYITAKRVYGVLLVDAEDCA